MQHNSYIIPFAVTFILYTAMFFLPFSAAENKTVYVRPGREEIIKRLEESKRLAGKYPDKDLVCTYQEFNIELYKDYSCKIAITREFFIKKQLSSPPFIQLENSYVEQFFPGGYYRDSVSPEKLSLPENSRFIHKSSRFIPAGKREDFLLELFPDNEFPVAKSVIRIAYAKNMRFFHGLTPPSSGRLPVVKKLRKNTYIMEGIPAKKSNRYDERIRFHVSAMDSWKMLGDILLIRMEKAVPVIPPVPETAGRLSPYRKTLYLYEKAKKLRVEGKEYILHLWLKQAGIKNTLALGKETRNINMNVACNFFTVPMICIEEQKGFRSRLWLDLAAQEAGKITVKGERTASLLLEKGNSRITFAVNNKK